MFYCELWIGVQASFHASALDISLIHHWCFCIIVLVYALDVLCVLINLHVDALHASLIFTLMFLMLVWSSYLLILYLFWWFFGLHTNSHLLPPLVLEIFNPSIVGVLRHALQLAFSFLFFVVHIAPFFALSLCIKVKPTTKGHIIETLCISLNVCLDNHMKPFAINFQCKRWPWCQELNSLLVVHITLNCSFNCS
jgi:hypothetical protein